MNLLREEALALTAEIKGMMSTDISANSQIILFPPFVHIASVAQLCSDDTRIHVGAQDCSAYKQGAFTGQVSASMIRSCGATHVLIGHSERRTLCAEDDEMLSMKLDCATQAGLIPVYCVGESLAERENEIVHHYSERMN